MDKFLIAAAMISASLGLSSAASAQAAPQPAQDPAQQCVVVFKDGNGTTVCNTAAPATTTTPAPQPAGQSTTN